MQRMFIKKCFLFTGGSIHRVKLFITGSQGLSKAAGAEVTETTGKILLCCGFKRVGKMMGQVYQCWWRISREISVFPRIEYQIFYVLYPSYILTLLRGIRDDIFFYIY
jgi:hypothetical protein